MKLANPLQVRRLCRLGQVSRAGFYRWRKRSAQLADPDLEVRDAIQRIALEFPCYGSRRIRFELRRRGNTVNRKRVQRLMREDNLLCLVANGIAISMSRRGNPYDNATCESFMKTLKYEEVYRSEYRDLEEARRSIGVFLEKVYNPKRLHSALGYLPPAEFEAQLATQSMEATARSFLCEFSEAWAIYRSDVSPGKR